MSDIITARDIDIITTEIKTIEMQVAKAAIYGCIEIGKRLVEAKEMVGHGGWGRYLEEKVRYSQQWATNLMNLYKEYGGAQESLFESFANSKSFGNIDVTKHILLLAVPSEERAAFAEEHDAENSTVRELQAAIRERDDSRQTAYEQTARAERAEAKAVEMGVKVQEIMDQLGARDVEVAQLQGQVKTAQDREAEATGKVDKLKQQLAKAKDAEKAAKSALEQAKAKPEIPESMMEEMRQQVAADAAEQATADIKKQLEAAQLAADEAERRRADAEARVAEAEKRARAADGNIALVKAYSEGLQDQFNKLVGAIKLVENVDPERGASLRKNAREKVLPAMMKALEG